MRVLAARARMARVPNPTVVRTMVAYASGRGQGSTYVLWRLDVLAYEDFCAVGPPLLRLLTMRTGGVHTVAGNATYGPQ